ncbi:MAG: TlyA family RNA methyltransferase [Acidimicrobiales bacterium]
MTRRRLDRELVRRGLAASAEEAAELVAAGRVTVGGAPAVTVTRQVDGAEAVAVRAGEPAFVTRSGAKLAGALDAFGLDPSGRRCLDAGASGGGFTDCLLQRGAAAVTAVDVGYGLLHDRIRRDPRVTVVERTNVRRLQAGDLGLPFDAVVADLSFISLRTVAPNLLGQARPGASLVLLVKPQFEATREEADAGAGVITDRAVHARVLGEVITALGDAGAEPVGLAPSVLTGGGGNLEYVLHARRTPSPDPGPDPGPETRVDAGELIARAVAAGARPGDPNGGGATHDRP